MREQDSRRCGSGSGGALRLTACRNHWTALEKTYLVLPAIKTVIAERTDQEPAIA